MDKAADTPSFTVQGVFFTVVPLPSAEVVEIRMPSGCRRQVGDWLSFRRHDGAVVTVKSDPASHA